MTIPQAFQLALQHHQTGRLADAEALYRQILAVQPNHADALHLLGVIAQQVGRHELAIESIRKAIVIDPNNFLAHSNLGETYRTMGQLDEAIASHRRALQLKPDSPEAHNNLGIALAELGRLDQAIVEYRSALELKPGFPEAHNNLGNALRDRGQVSEAISACHRALELKPTYPEAHNNLANALRHRGRLDEAIASYRSALALKPNYPEAHNNLGVALKDQGALDGSIAVFRHALQLKPDDARTHSNLIYTLHFHPGHNARSISEEQHRWNLQFSEPLKQFVQPHQNDASPNRRLRVGYVSPDFRDHVVGRYLLPLFQCHDRQNFEILCYAGVMQSDKLTEEFRRGALHWRGTVGVGDEALAEMIRQDGVDILVDLTQHMAGNRLPMFARRPAPVQVSFAGYPESTGLEAIEYRISDRYLEAGTANVEFGKKELVCLIESFWCYDPGGIDLEVNRLPAKESGILTFGCLNNSSKVNEQSLRLWARVLEKSPGSRIVLVAGVGSHRQHTLETLRREGVEADRVQFVDYSPRREYLQLYHHLDIALDPFPYNGGITTCEALWMGIPVISLAGETPVSRAGLSLLTNLGLPELVAHTDGEYIAIAESLAGDLPRLAELRRSLRDRMKHSVLMDAPRFARHVEQAYREMWQAWSQKQSQTSEE